MLRWDTTGRGVGKPRARSKRWAAFIAISICHGEEAGSGIIRLPLKKRTGYFLHSAAARRNTGVNGLARAFF